MTDPRIKYALRHRDWNYGQDPPSLLRNGATKVLVSEYTRSMDGELFCPGCFTELTRTPKDKDVFSNGRRACFAHLPKYAAVECDLRSTKPDGKRYASEEEALEAIAQNELVVVSSFRRDPPNSADLKSGFYDQSAVEDTKGPDANIAIARHRGAQFKVPTRISTVTALCRRFDTNLYRYYVLPGTNTAHRLIDILVDVALVAATDPVPRLYYAKIMRSKNAGIHPKPTNVRMTWLNHHPNVPDFCLKDVDRSQRERGIDDDSKGRTLIIWGSVTENGIGLCIDRPGWGAYALLPEKYEVLLP